MKPEQKTLGHELKGALLFILVFGAGAALVGMLSGLLFAFIYWIGNML